MSSLIIDVSSASVGVALVKTAKGKLPEIVFNTRVDTPAERPSGLGLDQAILQTLKQALEQLMKSVPGSIGHGFIYLSSPWFISEVETFSNTSDKEFLFDKKFAENLLKEKSVEFKSKLEDKYKERSQIFESVVTSLRLNGYESSLERSARTHGVELEMLLSATPETFIKSIEAVVNKVFNVRHGLVVKSFMTAFYQVLVRSFQNLRQALLVDMAYEVSDVLAIENRALSVSTTVPLGTASIIRKMTAGLGIPVTIASSYLGMYGRGVLEEATTLYIEKILDESAKEWQKGWSQLKPANVYLLVAPYFETAGKRMLGKVFGGVNIVSLGSDTRFTSEIVVVSTAVALDESLAILASHSQYLLQ